MRLIVTPEKAKVTCEICGATRTGCKANECGLAKAFSFCTIRTKHKASLDMLPFLAEETPLSSATPE